MPQGLYGTEESDTHKATHEQLPNAQQVSQSSLITD